MNPPDVHELYTDDDFSSLGFHDCYVYGIRWDCDRFTLQLDLDYIVKWVEPEATDDCYRFWVSPAELRFLNVADASVTLNWVGVAPECQIQEIRQHGSRTTPNNSIQKDWEIELAAPEGEIVLWATGFELRIKRPPQLSSTQRL
jgi:hypothetical protein